MPLVNAASDQTRRHALIIGTVHNQADWGDISAGVNAELEAMRRLLLEDLHYSRDTFTEIRDPTKGDLEETIATWCASIKPDESDWVLVYYTGHGVEINGVLRLITSDTRPDLKHVAPTAQSLVPAMFGMAAARHALLIIDTCNSGAAALDSNAMANRIREAEAGASRGFDFHLITSAYSIENAFTEQFSGALSMALKGNAAGRDAEYVPIENVVGKLNAILSKDGDQHAGYSSGGGSEQRFFPNPGWTPQFQNEMDAAARARVLHMIQVRALKGHWGPRARGVSNDDVPGWYFTGRSRAARAIIAWLEQHPNGGGAILRGLPGSGKSAVLARLATLADPTQRTLAQTQGALRDVPAEEIPRVGLIDVAIHARAKDASQIAFEIAAALELDLAESEADAATTLFAALERQPRQSAIIIDGLDESVSPGACARMLRELRTKAPGLRMLIGLRSAGDDPLFVQMREKFEDFHLDSEQYFDPKDIVTYVVSVLRGAAGSPYTSLTSATLTELGQSVAGRAAGSFLIASITAHALAKRSVVEPVESVRNSLPRDVGEALDFDLQRFPASAGRQLRAILTALAYSGGRGLPAKELLVMAGTLTDGDTTATDIEEWNREAGFYIVHDEEFGVPVRRLYHDAFAQHLRDTVDMPTGTRIAQGLLAGVPLDAAGAPAWESASAYLLAHLPGYLAAADMTQRLCDILTSATWMFAKARRFRNGAAMLSDLEQAWYAAFESGARPPLRTFVRLAAAIAQFATPAPPLVIDVLAAVNRRHEALLMAESISFPLDRCHAFAMLAKRSHAAGAFGDASEMLRRAHYASRAVGFVFNSMATYWVIDAAKAIGARDLLREPAESIDKTLEMMPWGRSAGLNSGTVAEAGFKLWQADRWAESTDTDQTFAIPHWLFWAAKCARELDNSDRVARIADVLQGIRRHGSNLSLQAAAVVGDVDYLREVAKHPAADGWVKPRNLALALIEAGLVQEFDDLRSRGVFDDFQYADASKRYAWALARRGDFGAAIAIASSIDNDVEEQARALWRIAEVAQADGNAAALNEVTSAADKLLAMLPEFDEGELDSWRSASWLASVFLLTGRLDVAATLANRVRAAGVVPSAANSLAMATPATARAKNHLRFESTEDPDRILRMEIEAVAESGDLRTALTLLKESSLSNHGHAKTLMKFSMHPKADQNRANLFLIALKYGALAGVPALRSLIRSGDETVKAIESGTTSDDLLAEIAQMEADMSGRSG